MTNREKVVAILSGGLDSTVMAYALKNIEGKDPILLSFNYGQRHVKELTYATKTAAELNAPHYILDMANIGNLINNSALTNPDIAVPEGPYNEDDIKVTVVPNRNAIMVAIATGLAVNIGAGQVAIGVHSGDHAVYPDCRPEFIYQMSKAMFAANEGFGNLFGPASCVYAPLVHMDKADIVELGVRAETKFEDTWSCYNGGIQHCGRCSTCVERAKAFYQAGVDDPTIYEDPRYWRTWGQFK